jgi:hypothetical protein
LSYAFAGGAALLALLTLLIALRQLHARGSQARG